MNQFHTTLSERRYSLASQRLHLFTRSCHLHNTRGKKRTMDLFCTFFHLPALTPSIKSLSPCTPTPFPVRSHLCEAAPRWRSPQLQKRPRWVWAQAGRSEPSVGTLGSGGPLSRLAPGGCAGSWRPLLASASGAPAAPPGLARAPHAPFHALAPWQGVGKEISKKNAMK